LSPLRSSSVEAVNGVLVDGVLVDGVLVYDVLVDGVLVDGVLVDDVLVDGVLVYDVLVDGVLVDDVLVDGVLVGMSVLRHRESASPGAQRGAARGVGAQRINLSSLLERKRHKTA